ncbi:thiamine pyrophosphate-binding protein [Photorhabdus tasmaniensis]
MDIIKVIAEFLAENHIENIFGMVNDGDGIFEKLADYEQLKIHGFIDQRAASAAALGYSSATDDVAVYCTAVGPSLANSLMGLLEAHSLRKKIVVFSLGIERDRKDFGFFQDVESMNLVRPISVFQHRLERADGLVHVLKRALYLSRSRSGISYIEIPKDFVHQSSSEFPLLDGYEVRSASRAEDILTKIRRLSAPLFVFGAGAKISRQHVERLDSLGILYGTTATGNHPVFAEGRSYLGNIGLYLKNDYEDTFLDSDGYIFIGTHIEETALLKTGHQTFEGKYLAQVNMDPSHMYQYVQNGDHCICDGTEFLDNFLRQSMGSGYEHRELSEAEVPETALASIITAISSLKGKKTFVLDNGLHDMVAYEKRVIHLTQGDKLIVPGEQTGLGLSIGMAIGAGIAENTDIVVAIVGDGALAMGRQAFHRLHLSKVPIIFVVSNNGGFSWPKLALDKSRYDMFCNFDTDKMIKYIGCEFGIEVLEVETPLDAEKVLGASLKDASHRILSVRKKWDQELPSIVEGFL